MENTYLNFANYLKSVNIDNEKMIHINGCIINNPYKLNFVKLLRPENETENRTEIIKDQDGNDKTVQRYSQVNEFIVNFGLRNDEEVKNKIKEYLNELLKYKNN